ncbi:hypothetical protein GQR58_003582 [Nymphon striatum]|nr:hypothetical protein GQR58_003582 [Nymphon striatum]
MWRCSKLGEFFLLEFRQSFSLTKRLERDVEAAAQILVHKSCRRDFTDKKRIFTTNEVTANDDPRPKLLRSSIGSFNFKSQCFLCGRSSTKDTKHPERNTIHVVTLLDFHRNLLEKCRRRDDNWSEEVFNRLNCCNDLVADEGRYHKTCLQRFMADKKSPDPDCGERGRPRDEGMFHWFEMLCIWLEIDSDAELHSLKELHDKCPALQLLDELYQLGFSSTYTEVNRFKPSAMASEDATQASVTLPPGTFSQHVADNVDHNLCTLDGKNTLHGMGVIQVSTKENGLIREEKPIKRLGLQRVVSVTANKGIPIEQPNWSGFMQAYRKGTYPGKSEVSYDVTVTSLKKVLLAPTFVAADDTVYHVFLRVVIAMEWSAKIVTMMKFHPTKKALEVTRMRMEIYFMTFLIIRNNF